jgi:hypothetical protein
MNQDQLCNQHLRIYTKNNKIETIQEEDMNPNQCIAKTNSGHQCMRNVVSRSTDVKDKTVIVPVPVNHPSPSTIGGFLNRAHGYLDTVVLDNKSVPNKSVPNKSVPNKSVPEKSVPVNSVPEKSVPVKSVPEKSVPVNSVPEKSVPVKCIPVVTTQDKFLLDHESVIDIWDKMCTQHKRIFQDKPMMKTVGLGTDIDFNRCIALTNKGNQCKNKIKSKSTKVIGRKYIVKKLVIDGVSCDEALYKCMPFLRDVKGKIEIRITFDA